MIPVGPLTSPIQALCMPGTFNSLSKNPIKATKYRNQKAQLPTRIRKWETKAKPTHMKIYTSSNSINRMGMASESEESTLIATRSLKLK